MQSILSLTSMKERQKLAKTGMLLNLLVTTNEGAGAVTLEKQSIHVENYLCCLLNHVA